MVLRPRSQLRGRYGYLAAVALWFQNSVPGLFVSTMFKVRYVFSTFSMFHPDYYCNPSWLTWLEWIEPEICLMCHAISCDSRWTLPLVFGRFQGEWFCAFSGAFLQEPGKKVPTWSQDYVTNRRIRMMTVARLHISEVWLFPRFFVMRLICDRLWPLLRLLAWLISDVPRMGCSGGSEY